MEFDLLAPHNTLLGDFPWILIATEEDNFFFLRNSTTSQIPMYLVFLSHKFTISITNQKEKSIVK